MQALNTSQGYELIKPVTTFVFMLATLMRREWLMYIRNPMKFIGGVLNAIVSVIIVGVFFVD